MIAALDGLRVLSRFLPQQTARGRSPLFLLFSVPYTPCEIQPLYTTKPLKRPTNSHCVFFWFSRGGGNQVIGSTFLHRWGRAFFLYALFKSFCPLDNVYLRKYFLLWDSKTRPPTFRAVHASSLCGRRRP